MYPTAPGTADQFKVICPEAAVEVTTGAPGTVAGTGFATSAPEGLLLPAAFEAMTV
jgi:hypothetical protein